MTSNPVLLDIGGSAYAHQSEVDTVKSRLGITHNYFDCWIFGFLENKNFNIDETVAKLKRREEFEKNELATHEFTEWMRDNMHKGIIQVIGNDKAGRVTFYVCTARDKPESKHRAESRRTFDMFVSYGTRLRPESKRCQMTLLVNQSKASMWSNMDMTLQAEIALRIAKYYPGMVDKVYVCNMGRILSAAAKPIFQRLPSIVSDRIQIITESDVKRGRLLDYFDADVLPEELGGSNHCNTQENYSRFATIIEDYFLVLRQAVRDGMSIKEWELQQLRQAGHLHESSDMDKLKSSLLQPNSNMHVTAAAAAAATAAAASSGLGMHSISDASFVSWRDAARPMAPPRASLHRSGEHVIHSHPHPYHTAGTRLSADAICSDGEEDVYSVQMGWSGRCSVPMRPVLDDHMIESGSDLFTCDSVSARELGCSLYSGGGGGFSPSGPAAAAAAGAAAYRNHAQLNEPGGAAGLPVHMPERLFTEFLDQFATIETFFRLNLEEMHRREWLRFVRQEVDERARLVRGMEDLSSEACLSRLPPVLRLVAKGFVWMCLMVMSVYFLLSTLFFALIGATTMTYFFFAMLAYRYNVFTYGLTLFVATAEFMLCCSRGFDMLRNTYNCRLLQALRPFGNKAFVFQIAVYVICVTGYFAFFCVMATRVDAISALLYSIAVGWIFTATLILVYHFIFAFGLRSINKTSYAHGSRVNHAEATLYLLLNVELDEEVLMSQSSMECIVPVMIALLAVASGVFYLVNDHVFFLCASFILTTVLLLLCTLLISVNNASSSANIIVIGLFYSGAFWMTTIFTLSRFGGDGAWIKSTLVTMCVMLFFLSVGFVGIYGPWRPSTRSWFFRIIWLAIMAHFIACDVVLLIRTPSLGGVVLVLGSHLILTNFRTNEATNTYGVCVVTVGFIAAVLTCCLVGSFSYEQLYDVSVVNASSSSRVQPGTLHDGPDVHGTEMSRKSVMANNNALRFMLSAKARTEERISAAAAAAAAAADVGEEASVDELPHALTPDRYAFTPLCTQRFGFDYNLTIRDLALFAKLGYNVDPVSQAHDLQAWFPSFRVVQNSSSDPWDLFSFTVFHYTTPSSASASTHETGSDPMNADAANTNHTPNTVSGNTSSTTIMAVRPSNNHQAVMESLTSGIHLYMISFMLSFMPADFTTWMHRIFAYADSVSPLRWKATIPALMTSVGEVLDRYASPSATHGGNHSVYIVGSGLTGTLASVMSLGMNDRVQSVVFSPTQLIDVQLSSLHPVTERDLWGRTIFVQPRQSMYNPWLVKYVFTEITPCFTMLPLCDELDSIIDSMNYFCSSLA